MEKKKKLSIVAVVAIVLVIAGIYFYLSGRDSGALKLYGNVDIRQVSVAFNASGRINEVLVEEGASVRKGQVLARLETRPLELSIAKLKAQVAMQKATVAKLHNGNRPEEIRQADANLAAARADAADAALNAKRMRELYRSGAVAQKSLDDAVNRYATAAANLKAKAAAQELAHIGARKEDIAAGEAQLKAYEAELATQEYNLSQATLLAPQDGVVRSRLLEVGDMASTTKAAYLMSTGGEKWVRVYIPEKRLGEIREGLAAKVTIDSYPDKPLAGRVGYIADTAEFTPKSVQTEELRTALVYEVRVYVEDKDNVLRLGMPATVTF